MSHAHKRSAPLAEVYDLAVVGGGINGAGIAADAAGRGLLVFLCEQDDLASHTSSASSKLIHGGLRYLEQHEWRLVRESLAEREVLLGKAPHLVKPLRFILPHRPHLRPAWMIRAGLFLYDHLGKREKLPASRALRFGAGSPLKTSIERGFEYSDCWVDDARLVLLNAMAAHEKGAHIHPRTRCVSARRSKGLWHLHLERRDGSLYSIRARALVNAAGPWVASFLRDELKQRSPYGIRLIQGSHLVVPRLYEGEQAYILQNEDRRIVFVIPYLQRFSLIGTTDREYLGDPAQVAITDAETDYLLAVVNAHFKQQLNREDILWSYSGVRPLCDDESAEPSAVTRDYTLSLQGAPGEAPLLSVFGGKLTTYRKLAEAALEQLHAYFPGMRPAWTASAPLPGGEHLGSPERLADELGKRHDWLPADLARRWANSYGTRAWRLLHHAKQLSDLGEHLGGGLYAREVDYLCHEEWAEEADDILWRRSKLGLFLNAKEKRRLGDYLNSQHPHRPKMHVA
ncbi:glycerol-3-phosphate dehydrogenase [Pseudomonas panipatensis]|uniref:Glycerol-3-phosphate dehydrogenase n=1 Tax=Pseudomonas panipatensis TaxID=428992 RepID=A0A1G8CTG7_9PSED|nr:glycerol-3-phosphate dehydrogenase [Pseudomonas panipatensis]SDH48230.1 glycerol-3-phosphate dehydrogenase [Pseudomonas panipatensis]SMP63706.1 homodimeric glycerol 3-phosphate dehydrogenase (quinone) [Pseudomonas panipatensis]